MKIAIIGAGNMGTAFAKGLLSHFDRKELELALSDHEDRHEQLKLLEVTLTSKNIDVVRGADVLILAVKPFDIEKVCQEISSSLSEKTIVISIAAGVKIGKISAVLGHGVPIVRVMPNLLATIGESMSAWFSESKLSLEQKKMVQKVLQSIGKEVEVASEDAIDQVTAISGSGPAYVWKFMETMIIAGVKIGLPEEQSRLLTSQTFLGAAKMASLGVEDVSVLHQRVTSKGGTTEQALRIFDERKFSEIAEEAVKAAYKKAQELGK